MRSAKRIKCGEVYTPTFMPLARAIDDTKAVTVPLPLVPAHVNGRKGELRIAERGTSSRHSLQPQLLTEAGSSRTGARASTSDPSLSLATEMGKQRVQPLFHLGARRNGVDHAVIDQKFGAFESPAAIWR